jgi:hypothetical protein
MNTNKHLVDKGTTGLQDYGPRTSETLNLELRALNLELREEGVGGTQCDLPVLPYMINNDRLICSFYPYIPNKH